MDQKEMRKYLEMNRNENNGVNRVRQDQNLKITKMSLLIFISPSTESTN